MLTENIAQYFSIQFEKPTFIDLASGDINQLEFDLKLEWNNGVKHDLNNHSLPISLELERK